MNPGFNELWPTTVYLGKIEDETLLSRVCDAIFTEVDLTNPPNDFHEYDILRDGSEVFQEFRDKVVWPAFEKYLLNWNIDINDFEERRVRAWLTGSYTGYAMPVHNHSGSPISSVFYLMNEEQQAGGELVLMDPRHNANRGYQEEFKSMFENQCYTPKSGEFTMFPGFVYHHTLPFKGKIRLAMPVDLFL
jgi:hypothetical protein